LGETALVLIDLKLDKFRSKDNPKNGNRVNEKRLKKSEILKANEYCKLGYAMFSHFTYLYAPTSNGSNSCNSKTENSFSYFEGLSDLHVLIDHYCQDPDESESIS
jgi:hypothetical protein